MVVKPLYRSAIAATGRELLGPANVTHDRLTAMVAALLDEDQVELLDVAVSPVDYQLQAITTAGRYWVSGHAATRSGRAPFRFFVKHVQSWSRHPFFQQVPEPLRDAAASGVPWRTEPLVYRSDLAARLPEGLGMARALDVVDIDELSAAVWLEAVPHYEATWDQHRFARAAYLLGRLAASPRVAPLAEIGGFDFSPGQYVRSRLSMQVLPLLRDPATWQHPLAAAFDAELQARVQAAADRAVEYGEELNAMPRLTSHGDACPNNLLAGSRPDHFVLVDFSFWNRAPVGFDLSQLLVGDVQIGRRSASTLAATEVEVHAGYAAGLRAEGCDISADVLRRAHALQLLIFTGLSSVPFEHFASPVTPELLRLAEDRARIARFSLDLVEATG